MNALANMTREELLAHIAGMHKAQERKLSCKVSEKGALSLYGLGRFPVTLYASQWERLLEHAEAIKGFVAANGDRLTRKE